MGSTSCVQERGFQQDRRQPASLKACQTNLLVPVHLDKDGQDQHLRKEKDGLPRVTHSHFLAHPAQHASSGNKVFESVCGYPAENTAKNSKTNGGI